MSFFQSARKTQLEMPQGAEREDLLAAIALRAGERKQQVQTLLEEYARQKDEVPEPEPTFRGVLEEVHPPMTAERRWTTRLAEAPAPTDALERIAGLEARLQCLESGQRKLIGIVEELARLLIDARA